MQVLTCTKTQYMAVSLPFASQRVCYALCTMQSKQGKANAALSILSRPKLFCSSGFTFTWRTSTCTRPPTSRKTQHEMVIQFTVSFNTHPQLKKHKYQIPIFLQNSHRKTLIPVQHKDLIIKQEFKFQMILPNSDANKCFKKYFQTLKSSATLYLLPTEQFFGAIEQLFSRRKNCDDCVGAHMVTFSVLWVINLSIWDAKRF